MLKTRENSMIFLVALSAGTLLIANLAATKLINFFGVAVDGGVVIFPLSYILGDLIVEIYGKKIANKTVLAGILLNVIAIAVFVLVGFLPAYSGWEIQESYDAILGFAPRIMMGSLLAYLGSGLLNNLVFEKIKNKTGEKRLWVRALGSSFVAKLVDILIFEIIAFLGVLSFGEFLMQAGLAFVIGMMFEIILTPITYVVVKWVKNEF